MWALLTLIISVATSAATAKITYESHWKKRHPGRRLGSRSLASVSVTDKESSPRPTN